jgi:hypothetical protein
MPFRNNTPSLQSDVATTACGAVSVGATSTTVVPANGNRVAAFLGNDHATQILYYALGATAVVNQGIRVAPGQTVQVNSYTGVISAIASGAATPAVFSDV